MKSGGVMKNKASQVAIRYGGIIASLAMSTIIGLTAAGYLSFSYHDTAPFPTYVLALSWLVFGATQFYLFSSSYTATLVRLFGYYLLGSIAILYVMGVTSTATTPYWILLAMSSFAFARSKGVIMSILLLWLLAVVDLMIHQVDTEHVITAISSCLAISTIIGATLYITNSSGHTDNEVEDSKKEARLQQESLDTLINNIADAVLSTDSQGIIRVFNAAAIGLLDTNKSLIGVSIDDILSLHTENNTHVKLATLLRKSKSVTINDSLRMVISDEEVRLEITYSPIRSASNQADNDAGYIIILRDVTKTKSLEEERDEFISVVSHELRTPITITEGAIDNAQLIFSKDSSNTELVKKSLKIAHDQTLFLSRMINDLSTLSRAERGVADSPEDIDIKELVTALKNEYTAQAAEKGLHFDLEVHGDLGQVRASYLYLRELLQNFVTNAIKYTNKGKVVLSVTTTDTVITFAVTDTGIGISNADQKKIFDKFYRSEDYRTRETGGTGLGLYVAQKLARKLATTITLKSRLNHGSTFGFSLPKLKK